MNTMSTQRLNAAEKDLEKFIKFLALKSTQVVVQSRLGEKIQTQCNPLATGNDWFNIVIQDHPDVYAETKRALALSPGESILQRLPLCVEISLKTVEGDQMVLEVWSLDLIPSGQQQSKDKEDKADMTSKGTTNSGGSQTSSSSATEQQTLKAAHAIYNRMGILLKSLISLTRATPGYKLSRRQCSDSYGIYYRIYVDHPQVHTLGEGHKNVRIGQLNTIVGALSMSVAYRTKMTITPTSAYTNNSEGNTIMVKSDHFRPADTTPIQQPINTALKKNGPGAIERKIIDIDKPLRPGAFTDVGKLKQYTEEDYVLPETPPFEWLIKRTRNWSVSSAGNESTDFISRKLEAYNNYPMRNGTQNNNNSNINIVNNNNITGALNNNTVTFKNLEICDSMQKKFPIHSTLSQSPIKSLLTRIPTTQTLEQSSKNVSPAALYPDDDNLLKELNFPFASPNSHVNDLAKFYRDCYHAPPLLGLNEIQTEIGCCGAAALVTAGSSDCSAVDDLSRQLEQFETSLEDYDKLVSQLGLSTSSSTGSRSSGGLQMSN